MKKILYFFTLIFFLSITISKASNFKVPFNSELTCELFYKNDKFTTKTWTLDTKKKGGYLNYVDKTYIEWHENIPVNENPSKWVVMFYVVDRYTGKGHWDSTLELDNEKFLNLFLKQNLIRKSAYLLLEEYLNMSGTITCRETNKKF